MKKLTWRYRKWLMYRCQQRPARRFSFAELRTQYGVHKVRVSRAIGMPHTMCLDENLDETLSFFWALRDRTYRRGVARQRMTTRIHKQVKWLRGYTDFTRTRRISPGAALILAAEYDRINRVGTSIPNTVDVDKWDPDVYATLFALGFFDLIGIGGSSTLPLPQVSSILQAPMQRGENANWQAASQALLDLFDAVGGDQTARVNLLGAVVDAIENVRGHAYSGRNPIQNRLIPPFWWLSGAADKDAKKLTLAIYDQGITIPVSLPNKWQGPSIVNAFVSLFGHSFDKDHPDYDGEALKVAMQLSATATGQTQRGKGLSKIRDVVSQCKEGRLKVISRRGIYSFRDGTETVTTGSKPLLGTYLEIEATF